MNTRNRRIAQVRTEYLEDRSLLSVITVTSDADGENEDGEITLREAVRAANENISVDGSTAGSAAETDVIQFADSVQAIVLTGGELGISGDLIIRGTATRVTIDGQQTSRHFLVSEGTSEVVFENLVLVNGRIALHTSGGSVAVTPSASRAGIDLTVRNSRFAGNTSGGHGGAIFLSAEDDENPISEKSNILITDSEFSDNYALLDRGGAIYVDGHSETLIHNSVFTGNQATFWGGSAIRVFDSKDASNGGGTAFLTVTDSTFQRNTGRYAISYSGEGKAVVRNSVFHENNRAIDFDSQGAETHLIEDSTFTNNFGIAVSMSDGLIRRTRIDGNVGTSVWGARVRIVDSEITNGSTVAIRLSSNSAVIRSVVANNSWTGIENTASLVVRDSVVQNNTGRGLNLTGSVGSEVRILNSSIYGNGGGILARGADLLVMNTTIADNSATSSGGGVWLLPGIQTDEIGLSRFVNSTISGNDSQQDGGGLYVFEDNPNSLLEITSSIVAGNEAAESGQDLFITSASQTGQFTHSIVGTNEGTLLNETGGVPDDNGNLIGTPESPFDAKLTPVGVFSDGLPAFGLQDDSPALDAGSNVEDTETDQRGQPRVSGSAPDIGAIEGSVNYVTVDEIFVDEGSENSPVELTLELHGSVGSEVQLGYETIDGSATAEEDYVSTSGTLALSGEDGSTGTVQVTIIGDEELEGDEALAVKFSSGDPGLLLPFGAAVHIRNDDRTGVALTAERHLLIGGTDEPDTLSVHFEDEVSPNDIIGVATIRLNGEDYEFVRATVETVAVELYDGDDTAQFTNDLFYYGDYDYRLDRVPTTVNGGAGDDEIVSQFAATFIAGRAGNDHIDAFGTISGGSGNDTLIGQYREDTIYGGSGDDVIEGGSRRDRLYGGSGNDTIAGGHGKDRAWGGSGDDVISGDLDRDWLYGGSGDDSIKGGSSLDRIFGGNGDDTLAGNQHDDRVFGEAGNDRITGGSDNDELAGGPGDDTIEGGSGSDTLQGGSGADSLEGQSGHDTLKGSSGNDTLDAGAGHDVAFGGDGNDTLRGFEGRDILIGADGSDLLSGGAEDDILIAGRNQHSTASLTAIRAEWLSDRDYNTRAENIRNGSSKTDNRSNGDEYLLAVTNVFDDGATEESLFGGADSDLFFARTTDGADDVFRTNDELLDEL